MLSGTVDVISPWELQLEEQAVYKYASVPRGSTRALSRMLTTSWLRRVCQAPLLILLSQFCLVS